MDRIDLRVEVAALEARDLSEAATGEDSATVQARVRAARERQQARVAQGMPGSNAALDGEQVRAVARCSAAAERLLEGAVSRRGLSARGYVRVLRVARTLADLAADVVVDEFHVAEALQFRAWDGVEGRS
jgi:magnesium chelatase family protein